MTNSNDSSDLLSNNNGNNPNDNSNSNQPSDDDNEMEYSFDDENFADCDIESEFTDIGAKIDLVMNTLDDMEKNSNHLMEQAKQLLNEFRSQE